VTLHRSSRVTVYLDFVYYSRGTQGTGCCSTGTVPRLCVKERERVDGEELGGEDGRRRVEVRLIRRRKGRGGSTKVSFQLEDSGQTDGQT
jgi:hypothetical protein